MRTQQQGLVIMNEHFLYKDRTHAGKVLAEIIQKRGIYEPIILALPRGGVPVAKEIADRLALPLDVLIVRKIGAPFNAEYGIGAMCEDLHPLLKAGDMLQLEHLQSEIKIIIEREKKELQRRIKHYREQRGLPDVHDKTVLIVDDGLATGVTAAAAGRFLHMKGAKNVILCVPVGPKDSSELLKTNVDEIICPYKPDNFFGIGSWFSDFTQVSDKEVISILKKYHPEQHIDLSL